MAVKASQHKDTAVTKILVPIAIKYVEWLLTHFPLLFCNFCNYGTRRDEI